MPKTVSTSAFKPRALGDAPFLRRRLARRVRHQRVGSGQAREAGTSPSSRSRSTSSSHAARP